MNQLRKHQLLFRICSLMQTEHELTWGWKDRPPLLRLPLPSSNMGETCKKEHWQKMVRSAIFISPSPQMSGPPYLSDSGRNLHENSSSQNALEPPKCTDHKTAQFCFHFLSIFLPANIKLHLKGRATIRISFNGDDFSLFFWGAAATRALGEFSMSRWGHISMSGRGLCMLAK